MEVVDIKEAVDLLLDVASSGASHSVIIDLQATFRSSVTELGNARKVISSVRFYGMNQGTGLEKVDGTSI